MKPKSENIKSIIKETRPLREKTCFDQKQGYPYKMAEKSAILKVIIMKLYTSIDKTFVNVNSNFEHFRLKNVIFVIFFYVFKNKMAARAAILDLILTKNNKLLS